MQVTRTGAAPASRRRLPPATPVHAVRLQAPLDARLDAELFRALGDPTRLRLFSALAKCGRPCTVGELAQCTAVDLSVVSRHLALLETASLLRVEKSGRSVYYAVRFAEIGAALRALAAALDDCARGNPC
jgi:ArsR family transcriptional regulator, arsenate/arsenite/antimonite-responsive transcriptional repressor